MFRLRFPFVFALFIAATTSPAAALLINNGLAPPNPANVIDTLIPEAVLVFDLGSAPTTVELVDGGQVGNAGSERFEAFDTSTILMSGGVVFDDIFTHDSSSALMTGGLVRSGVLAFGSSTITVDGGVVNSGVFVDDFATLFISGGSMPSVAGQHFGTATVSGGSGFSLLNAQLSSTIEIVGSGFAVNGVPVGFGEIPANFGTAGTLTGVLQSGETINSNFSRDTDEGVITGRIVLVPIPEPSTALLLASGLVAWAARRRHRIVRFVPMALVGVLLAPNAHALTIDFEPLEVVGFGNTSAGIAYSEDGFMLTAGGGTNPHFQFFETMEPRFPGSTALFFGQPAMNANLEAAGAQRFNLLSIDLARVDGGGGFVAFTGHLDGGGTVFQELVVPTGEIQLLTFNFSGFNNLVRVEWTEEFHIGHQFDNIVVNVIPEPSTVLLLASGLVTMAVGQRRTKRVRLLTTGGLKSVGAGYARSRMKPQPAQRKTLRFRRSR